MNANTTTYRTRKALGTGLLGVIAAGTVSLGAMTLTTGIAHATQESDCQNNKGTYSSSAPGDGHVYSTCTVGKTTIAWVDGQNPIKYKTPM